MMFQALSGLGDTNTTACIATCTGAGGAYADCTTGCCAQYPNDNICSNNAGASDPSLACQYLGVGCDVRQTPPSTSAACANDPSSLACIFGNFTTGVTGTAVVMLGVAFVAIVFIGSRK
jgi:hypothetical protein